MPSRGTGAAAQNRRLFCYSPSLRPIASLLSAISFSPRANVEVHPLGLKFTVEQSKSIQAHAYLQRDIFDEWEYNPPRTRPSSTARRRRPRSSSPLDHDEPGEEDPSSDDPFLDGPAAGRRRRGDGDNDEEEDEEADEEDGQGGEVFEISLSTMVEVLDVFGTAGVKTARQIEKEGDALDQDEEEAEGGAGAAGNRWKGKNRDRQREDKHQSALRMTYDGEGSPLVLLIEESGTITRCELQTYEASSECDVSFNDDNRIVKLIMKSSWLSQAFGLFDEKTSPTIQLIYNPPPPVENLYDSPRRPGSHRYTNGDAADRRKRRKKKSAAAPPPFRLEAAGTLGSTSMDFPDDREIVETLEWSEEALEERQAALNGDEGSTYSIRNSYQLAHLMKIKPALAASNKVSLRTDVEGQLSLQFMVPFGKAGPQMVTSGFVEFNCLPLAVGEDA